MSLKIVIMESTMMVISLIFVWHNLLNKKINFRNPKIYITLLTLSTIAIINNKYNAGMIKIMFITLIFMFYFRYIFKEKISLCIITPLFYQIIIMFFEAIYAIILVIIFKSNSQDFLVSNFGTLFSNIFMAIITIFASKTSFILKIFEFITDSIQKISKTQFISFCIFILIILSILPVTVYYKLNITFLIIFYAMLVIMFFVIIIYLFRTKSNYNSIADKYNIAINALNDYEKMIAKYRIFNHENKNLLLSIRAMIINNEKNVPEYIDLIVKRKYLDDEKLLMKINVIPISALRATIYSEILKIKSQKIKYDLYIDKRLKFRHFIELSNNTVIDICKIIGVITDNAIDEVKTNNTNYILINIFEQSNYICVKITNQIFSNIDVVEMYNEGYTTKGNGHGYGLSLVREIIKSSKQLKIKTEINKNLFSQILLIKNN